MILSMVVECSIEYERGKGPGGANPMIHSSDALSDIFW
jgi:hypothetical protein